MVCSILTLPALQPQETTDGDWAYGARTKEGYTADDLRKARLQLLEDTYAAQISEKASRVVSTVLKRSKKFSKAKRHLLQEQKLHSQQVPRSFYIVPASAMYMRHDVTCVCCQVGP